MNENLGLRLVWTPKNDNQEYVDLGLPSGTLWATCNLGASAPEEYGDYFDWGETEPKDYYGWSTYKWCHGSYNTLTKYNFNYNYSYNGFVDNKMELDPEDDAAYVNWGSSWRMPTKEQQDELETNCTCTWTTRNGVNGQLLTGPNGNTIFLPASGAIYDDRLCLVGEFGNYWSRTLMPYVDYPHWACSLSFWDNFEAGGNERECGTSIRAVRVP